MIEPFEWKTDSQGLLLEPSVHDGDLLEVCYKESKLTICVNENRRTISFVLEGIRQANLSVWSGSIVSNVILHKISNLAVANQSISNAVWNSIFDRQLSDGDIEQASRAIIESNPNSFIFVLLCSYGGTIACVADRVAIFCSPPPGG